VIFRREPLHKKLAREAGLEQQEPPLVDPGPHWGVTGIHGVSRATSCTSSLSQTATWSSTRTSLRTPWRLWRTR
jgi:hypothetical protein